MTLNEDSLKLIIEALGQYCEIMEKFHGQSDKETYSAEGEKINKIRDLARSLKDGLEK